MIDPKELRLGNLLQSQSAENPRIQEVTGIWRCGPNSAPAIECDCNATFEPEFLDPIPLTPEIVLAAGFVFDEKQGVFVKEYGYQGGVKLVDFRSGPGAFCAYLQPAFVTKTVLTTQLFFVHQLQNWFFAVSEGLELETSL
jgi:hypothetical protein